MEKCKYLILLSIKFIFPIVDIFCLTHKIQQKEKKVRLYIAFIECIWTLYFSRAHDESDIYTNWYRKLNLHGSFSSFIYWMSRCLMFYYIIISSIVFVSHFSYFSRFRSFVELFNLNILYSPFNSYILACLMEIWKNFDKTPCLFRIVHGFYPINWSNFFLRDNVSTFVPSFTVPNGKTKYYNSFSNKSKHELPNAMILFFSGK